MNFCLVSKSLQTIQFIQWIYRMSATNTEEKDLLLRNLEKS